jgi:UDP-GlcNAc:undecaprenyl-phosphate GlcNAc-1-phosphate transferase
MVLFVLSSVVLCFNLMGKLFLGDAGTYGVTFAFGLLATAIHARGYASLETIIVWFFIPVADCLRLMITRALKGASPMHGDRDHFHHRLNDKFGRDYGLAVYWAAVAIPSAIATLEPKFALVALVCLTAFYFSCTGVSEQLEPTTRLANREGGNTALLERAAIDGQ